MISVEFRRTFRPRNVFIFIAIVLLSAAWGWYLNREEGREPPAPLADRQAEAFAEALDMSNWNIRIVCMHESIDPWTRCTLRSTDQGIMRPAPAPFAIECNRTMGVTARACRLLVEQHAR